MLGVRVLTSCGSGILEFKYWGSDVQVFGCWGPGILSSDFGVRGVQILGFRDLGFTYCGSDVLVPSGLEYRVWSSGSGCLDIGVQCSKCLDFGVQGLVVRFWGSGV